MKALPMKPMTDRLSRRVAGVLTEMLSVVLAGILLLTTLSGCSLARADLAVAESREDVLIGVFVTTSILNTDDRIYAELVISDVGSSDSGGQDTIEEYIFPGIDGYRYFCPIIMNKSGECITTVIDSAIVDVHTVIATSDDSLTRKLTGTINFLPTRQPTVHLNLVYQCADGKVYLVPGWFSAQINQSSDEGTPMTLAYDMTTTITENSRSKSESLSVKLAINIMFAPQEITVMQMDKTGNQKIDRGTEDRQGEDRQGDRSTVYLFTERQ